MPTIKKNKNKSTYIRHGKALLIWSTIYNTAKWRKMRESYLMYHPICEKCNKNAAIEVHHITPISTAKDENEMKDLGFNYSNLMALCQSCHHELHNKKGTI